MSWVRRLFVRPRAVPVFFVTLDNGEPSVHPRQAAKIFGAIARRAQHPRKPPYQTERLGRAWLSGWDWADDLPDRILEDLTDHQIEDELLKIE